MSTTASIFGTSARDDLTLVRSASDTTSVDVFLNTPVTATPTAVLPVADLGRITFFGGTGADSVTLDYSNGDPIPAGLDVSATGGTLAQPGITLLGLDDGLSSPPVLSLAAGTLSINDTNNDLLDTVTFDDGTNLNLFSATSSTSLEVTGGSFTFNQNLGFNAPPDVTVDSGAAVTFAATQTLHSLSIAAGGSVTMAPAGGQLLDTNTLSVAGTLNLTNNDLLVRTPGTTTTSLQNKIVAGYASPGADGTIDSSLTASGMAVGFAPDSLISATNTSVDGYTLPSNGLLARYTYVGDCNLDGTVNTADFNLLASHYGTTTGTNPVRWAYGDLNADGQVNIADYNLLLANYGAAPTVTPATAGVAFDLPFPSLPTGDTAVRYDVDWGDGITDSYSSTAAEAVHTYAFAGADLIHYSVLLVDGSGNDQTLTEPAVPVDVAASSSTLDYYLYTGSGTDIFTLTSDGSGDTVVIKNGTTLATIATDTVAGLTITGDPQALRIDYSDGDPVPPTGVFFNGGLIDFGPSSDSNSIIATSTADTLGTDVIRHPATTAVGNPSTASRAILALAGNVIVTDDPSTTIDPDASSSTTTPGMATYAGPGASVVFAGTQSVASLNVASGSSARVQGSTGTVLVVGTISLADPDAAGNAGGVLDLGYTDMVVRSTSTATISTLLSAGFHAGDWNGTGIAGISPAAIVSSAAASDSTSTHTLGYSMIGSAEGALSVSDYDGISLSNGNVVVAYTLYGDANLDGVVDNSDYTLLHSGLSSGLTGWINGDFDYNGIINAIDLDILNGLYFKIDVGSVSVTDAQGNTTFNAAPGGVAVTIVAKEFDSSNVQVAPPADITIVSVKNSAGVAVKGFGLGPQTAITAGGTSTVTLTAPGGTTGTYTVIIGVKGSTATTTITVTF